MEGIFTGRSRTAPNSRARPTTLRASGRFHVTSMSNTVSGFSPPTTSRANAPVGASAGSSMMPSWLPPGRASSFELQSIPNDSTPRSFPFLILKPPSGTTAPILASTLFMPARQLGAPHTTCTVSLPSVTVVLCRCVPSITSHVSTSPTTKKSESGSGPDVSIAST